MARTVHCIKLDKDLDGMDFPPYPGELGKKIYLNVSKEAWAAWLKQQTMLVNENRLSAAAGIQSEPRAEQSATGAWLDRVEGAGSARGCAAVRLSAEDAPVGRIGLPRFCRRAVRR